ncbi:MAG TPA: DUF433 domain-containing protein [Phycisphaerae bacterium]|nr:DUF433 domain-containing protein [Phycisphaerae bacterium]
MSGDLSPYLGVGIYGVAEAARLTDVRAQRIRRWLEGYTFSCAGKLHASPPVWRRQLPDVDGTLALGFLDLIEVRFVDAFRRHGVTWRTIRRAAERARVLFDNEHPFCTESFQTDGRSIFAEVIDETGETSLIDVVKSQYAFKRMLQPYLYIGLEFQADQLVRWWPLGMRRRVVIDPRRAFGQPIVAKEGVPTAILAGAVQLEQSVAEVADWYEVDPRSVRDAVEFEEKLAA